MYTNRLKQLIESAASNVGVAPLITAISFQPGMEFQDFLNANSIENAKLSHLYTFGILKRSESSFAEPDPNAKAVPAHPFTDEVIAATVETAGKWFVELVACTQVSTLNLSNIENYFKSMQSDITPWKIEEVLRYLSSMLPRLAEIPAFESIVLKSTFVKYHTTAASSPSLMQRALAISPIPDVYTSEEVNAMEEALTQFHSIGAAQAIPQRAIVMTSVILNAAGALPPTWYMGQKAVSSYSPTKYATLVAIMRAAMRSEANISDLDKITGITELGDLFRVKALV